MFTQLGTDRSLILVTGATGYVGGRLVPLLLEAGHRVRCLARDASRLQGRPWHDSVEIAVGDVLQPETLVAPLRNIEVAYYLVHSMAAGQGFSERDQRGARNFSQAAKAAGVKRIIYLGGLGDPDSKLSHHLRSRHATGDSLRQSGIPVTEFRAGVIVGSGSLSFEIIRSLCERLPIMICPRWVFTRIQPIAIRNLLEYLVATLQVPESSGRIIEVGGSEVITYGEMLTGYSKVRGLKRWLIPVPVLTPRLSSYWVHLVTPVPTSIAEPLIEGLRNETIIRDNSASLLFPKIQPMDYQSAVRAALAKLGTDDVETAWSDALVSSRSDLKPVKLSSQEGMVKEQRQLRVRASPDAVFKSFSSLGGRRGWLYMNWAWQIRGGFDRLFGGVGMRRGRRDAQEIRIGDAIDFWRVENVQPGRLLCLRAEMRVPGKAWLQFLVGEKVGARGALLTQTAYFAPKGLAGLLYWYLLYPIHGLIFSGMIQRIAEEAEASEPESV